MPRNRFLHFPPNRRIAGTYCGQHTHQEKQYYEGDIIADAIMIGLVGPGFDTRHANKDAAYIVNSHRQLHDEALINCPPR